MYFKDYYNKVHGGWLGRVAGSQLGAPLEFRPVSYAMRKYGMPSATGEREYAYYVRPVDPNAVNDDEIYQIVGLIALEKHGPDLTAKDIGDEWKERLYRHQFTAEKVAFQNLQRGIDAPVCASEQNGNYWFDAIGAQMKADIWGLLTPDCPSLAADYARLDGAVAHQDIGIEGEVFVAAIISQAFTKSDVSGLIMNALEQLPAESEYRRFVEHVVQIYQQHPRADQWRNAKKLMMQEWNKIRWRLHGEAKSFKRRLYLRFMHGLHVLPNAGIIVLSLLYAQSHDDPFGRALCLSGMMGLDTDCNCGNIGTIVGVLSGADRIPAKWIDPLQDTFRTYVREYEDWKISELATRICESGQRVMAAKCPEKKIIS